MEDLRERVRVGGGEVSVEGVVCGNVVEVVVIRLNHGRDFVAFWSWTGRIVGAGLSVEAVRLGE